MTDTDLVWTKVAEVDELADGRVKSATAGGLSLAVVHFDGQYAAMDNHCPHQGGPLGEGSIETGVDGQCWLRCPWHGWDFHPLTGQPPGGHEDSGQATYPVETRADGIYVGTSAPAQRQTTISDIIADTLANWGLRAVFGMVGHSNLGLADAIRRQCLAGRMMYIGVRHEGAAAFAVSGYGKLTGRPAASLTIAGPGATNLLTGLWDAKVDRAPSIALTGQVQEQVTGVHAFQDIDLLNAFAAVSRFSQTMHVGSNHAELASQAVKTALVHSDVAHLVFPDNVQTLPASQHARPASPQGRIGSQKLSPDPESLRRAADIIADAKRPMLIAGFGARDAIGDITALAEHLHSPVATTFKGKGLIADSHPLAAGVLGRSGTPVASWFMNEADALIVIGCSLSDHTGIYPDARIVQVDRDPMRLAKAHAVSEPVLGDAGLAVVALREMLVASGAAGTDQRSEIARRWSVWREEKTRRCSEDRGQGLNTSSVFASLTRHAPDDCIVAVDVGNNTYSFGRYFEPSGNQRVLMSGYLGSIGFAFPAAMGAWAATREDGPYKERKVISISGDGGFGQYAMEFTTAVKYGMNICHILLVNGELGKISKEQRAAHFEVWQTGLHNPPFAAFARACGGFGKRVSALADLDGALDEAIAHQGPALVEIITDAELV